MKKTIQIMKTLKELKQQRINKKFDEAMMRAVSNYRSNKITRAQLAAAFNNNCYAFGAKSIRTVDSWSAKYWELADAPKPISFFKVLCWAIALVFFFILVF